MMMSRSQNAGKPLAGLLKGYNTIEPVPDIDIVDITSNSRTARRGSLFIALRGINSQGIDFAIDAVKSGAVAVIYDSEDEYCVRRISLLGKQVQTSWIGIKGLDRINA